MRRTRDKNQGQIIKGVIFSEMKDVALLVYRVLQGTRETAIQGFHE